MNINAGELNKKIKIITSTSGTDFDGFPTEEETVIRECWAKISNTSGTEVIKANAEFSEVNTRFLIRYSSKVIDEKMTIVFAENYYDILYINDYNFSHEYLEIITKVRR